MSVNDNTGGQWKEVKVEASFNETNVHIGLEAIMTSEWRGFLAVDDVTLTNDNCYEGTMCVFHREID